MQIIQLLPRERSQYQALLSSLRDLSEQERTEHLRNWGRIDLYFLLRYLLKASYADNDWCLARCREVQAAPNGYLDLWAREHFKSTIITYALTIQDILNDPELTVGIFSHTRPIAKAFLRQIKREFENNDDLKRLYPDVLWQSPAKEAPKWSEDEGIIVRRKGNPKEATVEAWGIVDGQPTSKHFGTLIYDDLVTRESVTTPEMIAKTTDSLALSYNLGVNNGVRRFIGTFYHFNDSYRAIIQRRSATPRIYPATKDGTEEGEPVLLSRQALASKREDMGPYIFGCQMLLNPVADKSQGFREEWLQYYRYPLDRQSTFGMRKLLLCDPANEKKETSDYTSMWIVGLHSDQNYYVLDMVRDRLNLTERTDMLFNLHRHWQPDRVGYERYGMQSDIEHIKSEQARRVYHFPLIELGGPMPKPDRIRRLVPIFEQRRIMMPDRLVRTTHDGRQVDLVQAFVNEEYKAFPVAAHDDMLDALSRLRDEDMALGFPMEYESDDEDYERQHARSAVTGY